MGAVTVRCGSLALTAAFLGGCLPDGHWKARHSTQPEQLDDGWKTATPESVGLDPTVLASIHADLLREDRHFGTLGFLVVKSSKLVFETYLQTPEDRERAHHIQSVTKSVTSMVFGIARKDGLFPDLDAPISAFLPASVFEGLDPRKRGITLDHLLTMRSGIAFSNDVFFVEMLVDRPADPLRYILEKPLYATPGEQYRYRDADPMLLSYVLQYATGMPESEFAGRRLLAPLGIGDYHWEAAPDGATLGGVGLRLRPRELAKIGQLMLECVQGSNQIVESAWCAEAIKQRIPPERARAPDAPIRAVPRGYGYYFWTLPDHNALAAWGHGGQYILVVPAHDLVLIQIAMPDSDYLHGGWLEDFVELTEALFCPGCSAR